MSDGTGDVRAGNPAGSGEDAVRAAVGNARPASAAAGGATVVRLESGNGSPEKPPKPPPEKPPPRPPIDPADLNLILAEKERNDLGNAERLMARHGHDILFVREVGPHLWAETHWSPIGAADAVRQRAHETARSIMEEVEALQKSRPDLATDPDFKKRLEGLLGWSVTSGNRARIEAMISEATPYLSVRPEEMDEDPYMLNLANGTLRLEGDCMDLRPHAREDRLAKVMNVAFDPEASSPRFDAFMARVQPDPDIRRFLQQWAGYCMTGVTKEQVLVFNYGEGGNGKSVFVDLLAKMMGPYGVSLPFSSLLKDDRKRGSDATPDLARLPGARLVRASEPEKGARFAEAQIKAITGGEEISVRNLHQSFFDFVPQFKLMLSGNHKPAIHGQDIGIWRRFLLVPWEENIPKEEQDRDLPEKLWAERAGVLNWILDGARMWLERGLTVPDAVRAATDDYRADSDPIGRFLKECVEDAPSHNVQARVMYDGYAAWCRVNAERVFSMTAFGRALSERGIHKESGRIRVYTNVRLVNLPEEHDESRPPPGSEDDYGPD